MASLADIFAEVKLDLTPQEEKKLKRKIASIDTKKEGAQVATRFGVGFNGAIGSVVSRSAGVFAAGFAAVQGLQIFGGFINDARESAKISRVTENAIRATGGAAQITAAQVGALATAISNKTAIDDEQVQTAANMLLTFKNIRNETGQNNDIFNRATQAVADLSVQFGGMDGAAKQVGKALNDPLKGITALSKAGVTFTDQQKEQIKTLVESGNTLAAQKIILKEIEGQVGGAAAAAADPVERLKVVAGNLAEEVGGFLLPAVNRFAGFATSTLIPGVQALFAAFQEGDVTSDGFIGFMERIGVTARNAFGFFKTEVLPRLREFAGFIKAEVVPRLQDFGGFLSAKVIPPVRDFTDKVLLSKDFLAPFAGIILGVVAALKAWAIIQGVLNVVMSANPIGIVVLAIAGLVAGVIYAYKHSEKFRNILQGAFNGIKKAAEFFAPAVKTAILIVQAAFSVWWNYFAKPILKGFGDALTVAWGLAKKFGQIVIAGFNAVKEPARAALQYVTGKFLGFVGDMLEGAAKAFGWVPGMGEKLKGAAAEFNKFKTKVNKALDGINDEPVDIKVGLAYTQALGQRTKQMKFAAGGRVFGAGTATSDSIPALLSNGEHVWTAREVIAAGGHKAMERMRKEAVRGFAAGGGVKLRGDFPTQERLSHLTSEVGSTVTRVGAAMAKSIARELVNMGGPSGPPGARRSYRGVTLNERTIRMLLSAERMLGARFHITQGSYSTRVAASGSTHAGGGAMDTNGPRGWSAAVSALRKAGFAAWHRTPSQGPWNHHIHSIALGDASASPAAKRQMASFRRGGNGLGGGMAKGGPVLFDSGGYLPVGRSWVENRTGKPEPLARTDMPMELSDKSLRRLAEILSGIAITLDGNRLDAAFSRRALNY